MAFFENIIAAFMAIIAFFSSLFGISSQNPIVPTEKFSLVWSDEFEGTVLDNTKWKTSGDKTSVRRGGYWNGALAKVENGNLIIESKYLSNGVNEGDPAGWYTTMVETDGLFEQTYGYFEVRCILPKGYGQWSAFWMMNNDGMSKPYPDGSNGGEIDIFESPFWGYINSDRVMGAVHWGGYGDAHKSIAVNYKKNPVKPYDQYNTYAMEWNEDEYIFYVNGEVTQTITKEEAITSRVPLYMILSTEIAGFDGVPSVYWAKKTAEDNGRDFVGKFIIDYVRVYQYN